MVKIRFEDSEGDSETLWATPISQNLYRLDNSPFFAYGVSWEDLVEARRDDTGMLHFVRRVESSGNRTLRFYFASFRSDDERAKHILETVVKLGGSFEGMQPKLIAVNVPPGVKLATFVDVLSSQPEIDWEYADPTYENVRSNPKLLE